MVVGSIILQEAKELTKKVLLSTRKDQFLCKIFASLLHGCGLHYNVLSGLSVKQEVKGLTTSYIIMHYPGVYLQMFEFIGATVSEFHFFINIM